MVYVSLLMDLFKISFPSFIASRVTVLKLLEFMRWVSNVYLFIIAKVAVNRIVKYSSNIIIIVNSYRTRLLIVKL